MSDLFRRPIRKSEIFPPRSNRLHDSPESAAHAYLCFAGYGSTEAVYQVPDADGDLWYATARFRDGGGVKQFATFVKRPSGKWSVGRPPKGRKLPLYGLAALPESGPVYIVEGEKCRDRLALIGVAAVTSTLGSSNFDRSDWKPLKGREVVILPDHDDNGESYARNVRDILLRLSAKGRVTIVRLPGLDHKEDVADWMDRLPSEWGAERIAVELAEIVSAAAALPDLKIIHPDALPPESQSRPPPKLGELARAVAWLRDRLRNGRVLSATIENEIASEGIAKRTLARARAGAGVRCYQEDRRWYHELLDRESPAVVGLTQNAK